MNILVEIPNELNHIGNDFIVEIQDKLYYVDNNSYQVKGLIRESNIQYDILCESEFNVKKIKINFISALPSGNPCPRCGGSGTI